jgi:hypothetical protein
LTSAVHASSGCQQGWLLLLLVLLMLLMLL